MGETYHEVGCDICFTGYVGNEVDAICWALDHVGLTKHPVDWRSIDTGLVITTWAMGDDPR